MSITKITISLLLLIALSGCSSFQSNVGSEHRDKNGMPQSQFGHPYSGLTSWTGNWCYFDSPNMEHTHVKFIVAPITFVFLIVDLPLTIIADTVLLPFELFSEPENSRVTVQDECNYSKLNLIENKKA